MAPHAQNLFWIIQNSSAPPEKAAGASTSARSHIASHVARTNLCRRREQHKVRSLPTKSLPPLGWNRRGFLTPPGSIKSDDDDEIDRLSVDRPRDGRLISPPEATFPGPGLYGLPFVSRDTQELRSFRYFRHWVAPILSGHNDSVSFACPSLSQFAAPARDGSHDVLRNRFLMYCSPQGGNHNVLRKPYLT